MTKMVGDIPEPQVLRPFHRSEVITTAEAARIAGRSERTIREWTMRYDIGRRIGRSWAISIVALQMLLDGNMAALAAYLLGDRVSPFIVGYFEQCAVPLPRRTVTGSKALEPLRL
jgi:hypothetical protein